MTTTKRLGLTIAGVAFGALLAMPTNASAALTCPAGNTGSSEDDRAFTIDITSGGGGASCYADGQGNINGDNSDFAGWTFIDKDSTSSETDNDFYSTGAGASSGIFTILQSLWDTYHDLLIVFKVGNNGDPTWVAIKLTPEVFSGNWSIVPQEGSGLSHINIYGQGTPDNEEDPPIPEPASMILLGTGLLGVARAAQKRLRTARS